MAEVNGKWLDYDERAAYLDELSEERDLLARLLTEEQAFSSDIARLEDVLDEIERVSRVHRGERDVLYFALEYFGEDLNPGNPDNLIPEGVTHENSADFHKELCGLLDAIANGEQHKNTAWACPRGSAKTSYLSNIFLVHQIVYRHQRYIVLFSETTDVAGTFTSWGRFQLKLNEKLREDFGELLYVKPSKNELDNKYEFITTNNIKVESKGLGTQTRGLRHGNSRISLALLDDLESSESTNTPELIEKSKRWFAEELMPALSQEGYTIYMGTIICYGSLLHHVIKNRKDFKSRTYSAVERFSNRSDLWEEWRRIYREDVEDSADKAYAFYKENESEMTEGVELLWPQRWSYYELMTIQEENGVKAFAQEYQNNPTDEERQIFKPEFFQYFDEEDLEGKNIEFYAGIDMSMGKTSKSDFTVITTIAKNVDTGVCYVYDAFIERVRPDKLLDKTVELALKYQYTMIGVEAVFGQEFIADAMADRLQAMGYPSHTRMKYIKHRTRKELRIEALLPDIQNGNIRFHKNLPKEFMTQFEFYGTGAPHDDAPDSCAMAYSTAKGGETTVRTIRKRTR